MSEELKPCPFCGKSDFTEEFYDKELVVCNPCDIGGDRANWQNRSIEDVLKARIVKLEAALKMIDERTKPYFNPIVTTTSGRMMTEIRQVGNIAFAALAESEPK